MQPEAPYPGRLPIGSSLQIDLHMLGQGPAQKHLMRALLAPGRKGLNGEAKAFLSEQHARVLHCPRTQSADDNEAKRFVSRGPLLMTAMAILVSTFIGEH